MTIPVRSIRLQKRSSQSLDTLSGASGEIFFDADQNTLRIYTANQASSIVLADRVWTQENTFSGDYADLENKPTLVTDYSQLTGTPNLAAVATSGSYNDLTDAPDLGALNVDISTIDSIGDVDTSSNAPTSGQLLQYDGTNWVNTTVSGFQDTNTTYSIAPASNVGGADIVLTDSDSGTSTVNLVEGTNVTIDVNLNSEIEISASSGSVSDLTDTAISSPSDGQLLGYSSGQWVNVAAPQAQGGIELTDLSATNNTASGGGSLSYDNTLGVFTFTPPDLSSYATTSSFSVTTSTASSGGSLSYSNGSFTFRPADLSGTIGLADLSVTVDSPQATPNLTYNNTTGVFTYTPPDLSGISSDVVDDTTPQLGGNLDLNNFNITGVGDIAINTNKFTVAATTGNTVVAGTLDVGGTVSANSYSSTATGAPTVTSASTITLTSPDGTTITDGTASVLIDAGNIEVGTSLYLGNASQSNQNPAISNFVGIKLDQNGNAQFTRDTATFANAVIYTNKNGNVGEHIQFRRPGFGGPQRVGAIGESTTGNQLGLFNQTSVEIAKSGELGLVFSSYTTTERDAATATTGEVIFNTTTTKLQVYTGSAWVDLH